MERNNKINIDDFFDVLEAKELIENLRINNPLIYFAPLVKFKYSITDVR